MLVFYCTAPPEQTAGAARSVGFRAPGRPGPGGPRQWKARRYNTPMSKKSDNAIAENRRARHDYDIEERYEAGLVLEGWEVKSLRAGRASIAEAHGLVRNGEVWLIGANISPLPSASTHVRTEPDRTRKLLLHAREIAHLTGAVERRGYTLVPLRVYWKRGTAKLELGLAKGRKLHDKRQAAKKQDWERQKARILREKG